MSGQEDDPGHGDGADDLGTCNALDYPIDLAPSPERVAEFEREVAALREEIPSTNRPDMSFAGSISNLFTSIPIVLDGQGEVCDQIHRAFAVVVAQRQALFRLDLEPFAPSGCQTTSSGTHILRLVRDQMGEFSARQQTLLVAATPDDSQLVQFSGDYIPTSHPVKLPSSECVRPDGAADVIGAKLPMLVFDPDSFDTTPGVYQVKESDSVTHDATIHVEIDVPGDEDPEDATDKLRLVRRVRVVVNPKTATPEVIRSDANCGTLEEPAEGDIVFAVSVDAITGEIVDVLAGECIHG